MKKFIVALVCATALFTTTACGMFGGDKEEAHKKGVEFAFKLLDQGVDQKLAELLAQGKISQEEFKIFSTRADEIQGKLKDLVNELHEKYKQKKESKAVEKPTTDTKTEDTK